MPFLLVVYRRKQFFVRRQVRAAGRPMYRGQRRKCAVYFTLSHALMLQCSPFQFLPQEA